MNMGGGMGMPEPSSRRGGGNMPWIVLGVVVVALVVLGVLFRDKLSGSMAKKDAVSSSGYQAVFLTNGQVYFGKLSDARSMYVTLKDIFYLQVTQPPLQGSQQTAQQQQQAQVQPQLSLVKLGNELHGPVDKMKINRDQILFFEDMKSDGKVAQAIAEYQKNPNPAPATNSGSQGGQQQTPAPAPAPTPTK